MTGSIMKTPQIRPDDLPELLAPAGSFEAACAALHYGADSIYMGLTRFSARAEAENSSLEHLEELVGYAHSLLPRRRVFVALNTLIMQHELGEVIRTLADIESRGVDGVIVQDLGVLRLARKHFPRLRVHASTQMAVHNLDGARVLADLGCKRVVLARELGLPEMTDIASRSGVEVEVFVHGALCYSYSGLCLFSSHALGRSGNRGRCAYCCRESFEIDHGRGLPFSMKDLALAEILPALVRAGVACLKIEGRMKSSLYVAAVTDYYRRRLDGRLAPHQAREIEKDLQTIFSRPWTKLYAAGDPGEKVIDPVNVGHRGTPIGKSEGIRIDSQGAWLKFHTIRELEKHDGLQIDVPGQARPFGFAALEMRPAGSRDVRSMITVAADSVIEVLLPPDYPPIPVGATVHCSSSQAVKRRYPYDKPRPGEFRMHRPMDVRVEIAAGTVVMTAKDAARPTVNARAERTGAFAPAKDAAKTREAIDKTLDRLGDTMWKVGKVQIDDPAGRFVPVSMLNAIRRELTDQLTGVYAGDFSARVDAIALEEAPMATLPEAVESTPAKWSLRIRDAGVVTALDVTARGKLDDVILLLEGSAADAARLVEVSDAVGIERVRAAIPAVTRAADRARMMAAVRAAELAGVTRWEVANIGGPRFLAEALEISSLVNLDVVGDWPLYALNTQAVQQWFELGMKQSVLSPEDCGGNMEPLLKTFGGRLIVPVVQYTPVFMSETAPETKGGKIEATKSGERYETIQAGTQRVLVGLRPYSIAGEVGRMTRMGAGAFRLDYTWCPRSAVEAADEVVGVLAGKSIAYAHEGNYRRGMS